MALFDLFKKKPDPLAVPPKRLAESLMPVETRASRSIPAGQEYDALVPAGIDFASLWEEPQDASMLGTIMAGASAVLSLVTLIVVFVK